MVQKTDLKGKNRTFNSKHSKREISTVEIFIIYAQAAARVGHVRFKPTRRVTLEPASNRDSGTEEKQFFIRFLKIGVLDPFFFDHFKNQ